MWRVLKAQPNRSAEAHYAGSGDNDRLAALETEVVELRLEVADLKQQVESFKKQFE